MDRIPSVGSDRTHTSDLNLNINTNCLSASNKTNDALCFLWAGTRANYGFKQGKICYEIRIIEIIECSHMPDNEKEKFGIRIGWSNLYSGLHALQLGEFNDSFAYTYTGKKICKLNDEFSEDKYGESFGVKDILGCYIDFGNNDDDNNKIYISFTKNGQDLGQAFELDKTNFINNIDENRLIFYPHILVKNIKFECNFGQLETSWSEIKNNYIFPQNIPLNERIHCSKPILEKNDCHVILLSGLIGSGKTTWANKYIEDNPTKNFNLINVEYVLRKMTIDGKLPIIKDRNDGLMLRVNICLQKLIEIAAQRRRNYIIDHVNISRETQSKRQRLFTGYHRIGVVIVPNDDELKARIEKIEKAENISIPSQWIREAKAKFHFLQKGSSLEDVIYPELSYEDAKSLYDKIHRDYDQHRSSSSRYDRHDDHRSSRNDRNRYDDRDRGSRDHDRYDRYNRSQTQSKRQRLFTGYHRIGVVIVPNDDELKSRIEKIEKAENISIPSQWIREAKAKFHFLQKGSSLEDVIYPELSYEDAKSLYDKIHRDYDQHRSSSSRYDRHDDHRSSRNDRNRYDDRDRGSRDHDRYDRYNRSRSRERGSRDRDRDRRTSREDSRYSSSRRNDNYSGGDGGHNNNNYRGGGYSRGGSSSYSDHRQDSRNNNSNQRGSFHERGYHGRGGNNQSNDGWRGGYHQQQRNDFGGGNSGRGRGDFRTGNQFNNNRGSYHDNQRGGSSGFRSDFNNQQRGRQFNEYDNNSQRQGSTGGFIQNNNNFNQQHDRQGFGSRPPMQQQQQQNLFQNQSQRPQSLLQNPPSIQQQQFPSQISQQITTNNPNLSLQSQNPLAMNPTSVTQPSSLDSWFALYAAAALNPQVSQQQIQPQQDTNSITQWTQWLKTAQMGQAVQQQQPQITIQQPDTQHHQQQQNQLPDAAALYYQAYYAQLAVAQQQAAAAGSTNGSIAPPGSSDKSLS
ncbi:unnamed protein product [Rotaria sp. Silwood1]|nr:unnamed protein product [Rotaria sp. Silwood1]